MDRRPIQVEENSQVNSEEDANWSELEERKKIDARMMNDYCQLPKEVLAWLMWKQ
jgi:hypothetical protein